LSYFLLCITIVIDPLRITIVIDLLHITIVIVLLHITIVIDLLHITFVIDLLHITIVIDLLRIAIVIVLLHIMFSKFVYSCYCLIFIFTQTKYVFCRWSVGFCGAKKYHIAVAIEMKVVKYVARHISVHSESYKWKSVCPMCGRSRVRSLTASYQRHYKNGTRCFRAKLLASKVMYG